MAITHPTWFYGKGRGQVRKTNRRCLATEALQHRCVTPVFKVDLLATAPNSVPLGNIKLAVKWMFTFQKDIVFQGII